MLITNAHTSTFTVDRAVWKTFYWGGRMMKLMMTFVADGANSATVATPATRASTGTWAVSVVV